MTLPPHTPVHLPDSPNTNGSQFFITLEKTEWLEHKNTIFGKIVGDTIYNLLRIGECGVSGQRARPGQESEWGRGGGGGKRQRAVSRRAKTVPVS